MTSGKKARELAMLICFSEEAIQTFMTRCHIAVRDLLLSYGDVVIVLSTVLRIKRTLDGAEIDKLISDVEARKAAAFERIRLRRRTVKVRRWLGFSTRRQG
jgi:hypothetical protein